MPQIWVLQFLCKFVILRPRGSDEEVVLSSFFCIYSHSITMTKIENRDFALIFSGKRLFNTLSKIDLSDIVIITMNFHQHLAWQMLDSKFLCHVWIGWNQSLTITTNTDQYWPLNRRCLDVSLVLSISPVRIPDILLSSFYIRDIILCFYVSWWPLIYWLLA